MCIYRAVPWKAEPELREGCRSGGGPEARRRTQKSNKRLPLLSRVASRRVVMQGATGWSRTTGLRQSEIDQRTALALGLTAKFGRRGPRQPNREPLHSHGARSEEEWKRSGLTASRQAARSR